jgi:hypothetical protein
VADQSDVENALAALIAGIVYPNGTTQPSIVGNTVRIYPGWPVAEALDADLAATPGVLNVTVFPRPNMVRNTTRWMQLEMPQPPVAPTITASASGATVTFAGTITAGNLVGIAVGTNGYSYQVLASDTLASVAIAMATLTGGTATGASVTLATNVDVLARTVALGGATRETRRTEQGVMVSVWAPDPTSRDAIAKAIDTVLSDMPFFVVVAADNEVARLRFQSATTTDKAENANLYRRDLIYHAEYGTQIITAPPRALWIGGDINDVTPFGQTYPS